MFLLIYILYSAVLISRSISYIFDVKYSYIYPANQTGYSVFLQKHVDGFRFVAGAPKSDKLSYCYNETSCQTFSLSVKNTAGFELFGAAINGGNEPDDPIYVCAPRYITSQYRVNGRCFALHDRFKEIKSLSNAYSQIQMYNNTYEFLYAHGQAGFSIKYVDKTDFLLGAPGVLSWKGTVIKHTSYDSKDILHPEKKVERFSYLGYSLEYGEFDFESKRRRCIIAGAPRGDNLLGQVIIFDYNYIQDITLKILKGDQISSYFGSSLLTTTNELFVGAPMYKIKSFEEGCVFIYLNNGLDLMLSDKICGNQKGGRFGTAMIKIGFVGKDKNLAVAISAPYADDGAGIVYIYVKGDDGYKEFQQIFGKSVSNNIRGFGFSLSNAVDVDKNHYNDFAVGSLLSDYLIILRSRKILHFTAYINSYFDKINANTKNISIGYCFQYTGRDDKDIVNTEILLENNDRVIFVGGNTTIQAKIGENRCKDIILVLKPHAFDSPLPLKIKIINKLEDCAKCPVVFPKGSTTLTHQISFATGCGDDNICTPNLILNSQFENISVLTLGTRDTVTLTVLVTNLHETAYLCKMNMTLPTEISQFPAACSKIDNVLYCDISNRLLVNQKKRLQFQFDVKDLDPKLSEIKINITVSSAGSGNGSYVTSHVKLPVILKSTAALIGFSIPDYLESKKNVNLTHEYLIFNSGPSPLLEKWLKFQVPEGILTSNGGIIYPFTINPLADECISVDEKLLRKKRDTTNLTEILADVPQNIKYYLDCRNNELIKCKFFQCIVGELKANASLKFKFKIEVNTFLILDALGSKAEGKSLFLIESIATLWEGSETLERSAHTVLFRKKTETPDMWMWLIIAVLSSLVILAVIIGILYKLKFFARPMREKLMNEEGQKHERECMVVNDEYSGDDSADTFNDIHF